MTNSQTASLSIRNFPWTLFIAMTVVVPAALAAISVALFDQSAAAKSGPIDPYLGMVLGVVLCVVICASVLAAVLGRRSVELSGRALAVKFAFYTLRLDRSACCEVSISEACELKQAGISLRRNGIAIQHYLAGHFSDVQGRSMFCAVAELSVVVVDYKLQSKPRKLVLSNDADAVKLIRAWANLPN